ncbi:uncharacterized protein [Dermacentor andersoni]|uniref:uncharacterized protein isoform X2 n=1 Tax=Dermacentor andersoni TaxID=34620 RepID=UPI003B3A1847
MRSRPMTPVLPLWWLLWCSCCCCCFSAELPVTASDVQVTTLPSSSSEAAPTTIFAEATTEPLPSSTPKTPTTTDSPVTNDTTEATSTQETTVATAAPTTTSTTVKPVPKLSNVSAPCSERLGTFMRRMLRGFPSRLPELWEFRRRRFLRAAVVGGLPQLAVERMQVNCNLSSAHTTWNVRLRAQLDGICNLGITGLPRMYLRFTGPVVANARFGAALSDDSKPQLDELQILSADVQEIHYQSVLGFEQPFVERASKYLLQRALREEVLGPLREAINAEIENPSPDPPATTEDTTFP